jgi:hypothetical protein
MIGDLGSAASVVGSPDSADSASSREPRTEESKTCSERAGSSRTPPCQKSLIGSPLSDVAPPEPAQPGQGQDRRSGSCRVVVRWLPARGPLVRGAGGFRPSPPPDALLPPRSRAPARARVPANLVRGAQISTGGKCSVFASRCSRFRCLQTDSSAWGDKAMAPRRSPERGHLPRVLGDRLGRGSGRRVAGVRTRLSSRSGCQPRCCPGRHCRTG